MLKNLKKNRFWLFKALETYALALYFIVKRSSGIFSLDGYGYLEVLDDPPFIFMLACVGTVALVYALWDVKNLYYRPVMTGLLTCVWSIFFLSFTMTDILVGVYVGFPGIFAFLVAVISALGSALVAWITAHENRKKTEDKDDLEELKKENARLKRKLERRDKK